MAKVLLLFLCVASRGILQLCHAREEKDILNDLLETHLEVRSDGKNADTKLNRMCHCENSSCSCCVKEFRKRICASIDFIEKIGVEIVHVRVHMSINDKQVVSQIISTDSIPPICYSSGPLGVCAKLNVTKNEAINVCTILQVKLFGRVKKEHNLFCLPVPRSY